MNEKNNSKGLTSEQKLIVEHSIDRGKILIINAGPGTGKTTILLERVKYIYQNNKDHECLILVLAFNKNISLEIFDKLKQERLIERNSKVKIENRTIHSLCYSIFSQWAEKTGKKFKIIEAWFFKDRKIKEFSWIFYKEEKVSKRATIFHYRKDNDYIPLEYKLLGIIWMRFKRYVLKKKHSEELEEKLKSLFRDKVEIERENSFPFHHKIIHRNFLKEIGHVLTFYQGAELYEPIKDFFLNEKYFWISFEDLVSSTLSFLEQKNSLKKYGVYDYVLVDECQDLDEKKVKIIKKLTNSETNLTFAGDPKQNIYGFTFTEENKKNGFELLKSNFPAYEEKFVWFSFRLPKEILELVNIFSRQFLGNIHYDNLLTNRKGGEKCTIFLGKNWEEQMEFFHKKYTAENLEKFSTALLYRNNKTGRKLKKWFRDKNWSFLSLGEDEENEELGKVVDFLEKGKKRKKILSKYNDVESFINGEIDFRPQNQQLWLQIKNFDNNQRVRKIYFPWEKEKLKLDAFIIDNLIEELEETKFSSLVVNDKSFTSKIILSTVHGVKGLEFDYVFLLDLNEGTIPSKKLSMAKEMEEERRVFYVGITRAKRGLFLCNSDRKQISQFLLIFLMPKYKKLTKVIPNYLTPSESIKMEKTLAGKQETINKQLGDKGENEVYNLLRRSGINFHQLIKDWREIENLQVDIFAETDKFIHIIEVKNWNEEKLEDDWENIVDQQDSRKTKIDKHFAERLKNINYIVTFSKWSIANNFSKIYCPLKEEMIITHYDVQIPSEVNSIERIDKLIKSKERKLLKHGK